VGYNLSTHAEHTGDERVVFKYLGRDKDKVNLLQIPATVKHIFEKRKSTAIGEKKTSTAFSIDIDLRRKQRVSFIKF